MDVPPLKPETRGLARAIYLTCRCILEWLDPAQKCARLGHPTARGGQVLYRTGLRLPTDQDSVWSHVPALMFVQTAIACPRCGRARGPEFWTEVEARPVRDIKHLTEYQYKVLMASGYLFD